MWKNEGELEEEQERISGEMEDASNSLEAQNSSSSISAQDADRAIHDNGDHAEPLTGDKPKLPKRYVSTYLILNITNQNLLKPTVNRSPIMTCSDSIE